MTETASELRERVSIAHTSPCTSYGDTRELLSSFGDKAQEAKEDLHLRDGLTFRQYMLAGSIAGIVEHVAMFPVDTWKTRVQMLSGRGSVHPLSKALLSVMKAEGVVGLYRGIGAVIVGAGPSHAVYFSAYEFFKEKFGGNKRGHHPLAHMAAGSFATVASDAVLTPMDVVKQRLQLSKSPYRGLWDCVSKMLQEEGLRSFYVSYRTTVLMNIPFVGVHFATYEEAKKLLSDYYPDQASEEHLLTHLTAGGVAGAFASAVTTPLDVVKTRLQCQGVCGAQRFSTTSIREVGEKIIAKEGAGALFKGLKPRILFHTPAAAISWSTYEGAKAFLQQWNERQSFNSG